MTKQREGVQQILAAVWVKDDYGCLNLHVEDRHGHDIHAWLTLRPPYCDRGHIQLNVGGPIGLDGADCFPRYFFSFAEADEHARLFLRWRLWQDRFHPHTLSADGLNNEESKKEFASHGHDWKAEAQRIVECVMDMIKEPTRN